MMFLYSGMRAEVEPVPGKKGWFQLTGQHIERWTVDVQGTFGDLKAAKIKVNYRAKIFGIHDRDPEIALHDPRFNYENDPDRGASFGVYTEAGRTYMLLAVNQAEYVLFRFLAPHEAAAVDSDADEKNDPISDYRAVPPKPPVVTELPKIKAARKVAPAN